MRSFFPAAYTLVELLVALALSLLLLLAVTELFSRVGGTMNDTRAAMSTSASLHEIAILLRQDLARIPDSLATKPARIVDPNVDTVSDSDGYLEIIEGPDTIVAHPYVDADGNVDATVGDVDDIIAFVALADHAAFRGLFQADFRGVIVDADGEVRIEETKAAEIVWFVRGNTLYRRVRLVNEVDVGERALRQKRLLHAFAPSAAASDTNVFPYPLYDPDNLGWRYLRLPTLEETLHQKWIDEVFQWKSIDVPETPTVDSPDLWEQPYFFPDLQDRKSGALLEFVNDDPYRNPRAGEDAVLTNVLSFDVKVWCPEVKEFVDLGTSGTTWEDDNNTEWIHENNASDRRRLLRTWDSWTREYGDSDPEFGNAGVVVPPYTAPLEAIQITIRCFDPASRIIKQVTVVHRFKDMP